MPEESRQRITLLSLKDLEVSYFCGSGAGGQARNKVSSGVQMRHLESGAIGRASDSRSQYDNKRAAFRRLVADPRMKFWLARRLHEVRMGETVEESVEKETTPDNLRYEVQDAEGRWVEVSPHHFDSSAAS